MNAVCRRGRAATLTTATFALAALVLAPAGRAQAPAAAAAPAASPLPRVPAAADLPKDRPLRAGFLVLEGVDGSELMAAYDVLQHTVRHARPGIEVSTVSPVGNDELIAWLTKVGNKASYVVSLSEGSFLLARAAVNPTRLTTTSLDDQDAFAQMFPKHELRRNVSFVHDGPMLSSVGGARTYDAALYLVDHLYGEEVAKKVAAALVFPWPPGTPQDLPALVIRYRQE